MTNQWFGKEKADFRKADKPLDVGKKQKLVPLSVFEFIGYWVTPGREDWIGGLKIIIRLLWQRHPI